MAYHVGASRTVQTPADVLPSWAEFLGGKSKVGTTQVLSEQQLLNKLVLCQ